MKQAPDIFARLRNGENVPFNDPEYHKLRDASFATRKLLLQILAAPPGRARRVPGVKREKPPSFIELTISVAADTRMDLLAHIGR